MRILITAGPTQEPIDPVRYIGNRSSGQMGQALANAAVGHHSLTLILGPLSIPMPNQAKRIDVQTTQQMHDSVLAEFPNHDLLIMAAAVADFRPRTVSPAKIPRGQSLTLELEPTPDILTAAGAVKRADQRTIGFSLVEPADIARSLEKMKRKNVDLIVSNPLSTMGSGMIEAILLWPDGRREQLHSRPKADFADNLLERAVALFPSMD